ncbi:MAG: hypothetical protein L3K13_00825 [Thermoplasmata archaeon]|nr:hypothetical protein [Thermoplasmata archaeon]
MDLRSIRSRLALVQQGAVIGWAFGTDSLAGLLRGAELLRENMLEPSSFRAGPDGLRFQLRNPPLRTGAFASVSARVDGVPISPERAFVDPGSAGVERSFASIDRRSPVELAVGVRHRFRLETVTKASVGEHTIRLELRSVAIPPTSWLEFTERFEALA